MDEFFEIPDVDDEQESEWFAEAPPWERPPQDVIAALVPDRRVLAKTERLTVLLTHIDVFPTGASVRVRVMARRSPSMSEDEWREMWDMVYDDRPFGQGSKAGPEFLRIGIQLADGRKATNVDRQIGHPRDWHDGDPPELSLNLHGGGGSGEQRSFVKGASLWLWPLPPPEPFDLVIEWPAFDIPVTRTSIDGAAIVAASRRAEPAFLAP